MFENLVKHNNVIKEKPKSELTVSLEFLGSLFKSKEQKEIDKTNKLRSEIIQHIYQQEKQNKIMLSQIQNRINAFEKSFDQIESKIKSKKINVKKFETLSEKSNNFVILWKDAKTCLDEISLHTQGIRHFLEFPLIKKEEDMEKYDDLWDKIRDKAKYIESIFDDASYENLNFKEAGYTISFISELLNYKKSIIENMLELPKLYSEFNSLLQKYKSILPEIKSTSVLKNIQNHLITINDDLEDNHPQILVHHLLSYAFQIAAHCYE